MGSVIGEKLLTKDGDNPSIDVQAKLRRKDQGNLEKQTLYGKIWKQGFDLWGIWEDKPSKEYPFPHPELDYFEVNVMEQKRVPRLLPSEEGRSDAMTIQGPPEQGGGGMPESHGREVYTIWGTDIRL